MRHTPSVCCQRTDTIVFVRIAPRPRVTSPQARPAAPSTGWKVAFSRPHVRDGRSTSSDQLAGPRLLPRRHGEEMMGSLKRNCRDAGIRLWAPDNENQGNRPRDRSELGLNPTGEIELSRAGDSPHTSPTGALRRHCGSASAISNTRSAGVALMLACEPA